MRREKTQVKSLPEQITTWENGGPVPELPQPEAVKWPRRWPLAAMSVPAMLAIWSGWVELGEMTGYGPVKILPGIADVTVNTAIALPVGVEIFAVTTMSVWFSPAPLRKRTRRTAMVLSLTSALLGLAGQVGYHTLVADGVTKAPNWLTMFVSCLPVLIVVCAAALYHLVSADRTDHGRGTEHAPSVFSGLASAFLKRITEHVPQEQGVPVPEIERVPLPELEHVPGEQSTFPVPDPEPVPAFPVPEPEHVPQEQSVPDPEPEHVPGARGNGERRNGSTGNGDVIEIARQAVGDFGNKPTIRQIKTLGVGTKKAQDVLKAIRSSQF